MMNYNYIIASILLMTLLVWPSMGLHVKGTWKTGEFFRFLAKFGFQKTDFHNRVNTLGYIYGNITATHDPQLSHRAMLVVLNRDYFLEYYGNRTLANKTEACAKMFKRIDTIAYDPYCHDNGTQDFLRNIPCPQGKLCEDEDEESRVVKGHQFTYAVQDRKQARFWYISLVACYRSVDSANKCQWHDSTQENIAINYDMWLVNGNSYVSHTNPFEFQFSFDQQDTVEMYLGFFVAYLVLVPLQLYAVLRQHHIITRLFTASLVLQLLSLLFVVIHKLKFAVDGVGEEALGIVGDVILLLSQSLFVLLLLLLAKGWAITRMELTWKPVLFCIWFLYTCVTILLYVWNMTEVDVIEDIDEYQTFPGWMTLTFRLLVMAWFLYELRSTMLDETDRAKLRFYLHFGAGILVWFVYLPAVALIALEISALWRYKLLLGITSSANFLAFAVMTHLLWPTRSEQYFQLASELDVGEELEEFNEAPHNIARSPKV